MTYMSPTNLFRPASLRTWFARAAGLFLAGQICCPSLLAQTWQTVAGGVPAAAAPSALGGASGNTLYVGFGGLGPYKSTDNGATWTRVPNGLESVAGDLNSSTLDARSFLKLGNRIVYGTTVQSWRNMAAPPVFYSDNGGASWTPGTAPGVTIAQFLSLAQMGNYAFAADPLDGMVWRSTDSGANWTVTRTGLPTLPFSGFTAGVGERITTVGTRVLLATKTFGIYASDDLGATWYDANNGIALFPYQVFNFRIGTGIVTANNGRVFAAVDSTIYASTDQGTTWTNIINSLPIPTIRRLTHLDGKVYASTPTQFIEIDATTYSIQKLPFTGMDTVEDVNVFLAHNNYLYVGGASSLKRLNLPVAARTSFAPAFHVNPAGGNKLAGQSHTFTATATGTLPITYQWRKGGQPIQGQTGPSYTIASLAEGDQGTYDVVATGPGGSVASTAVALNVQAIVPGSLDSTFTPNTVTTGNGSATGSGGAVLAVEPLAGGAYWIAGQWDRIRPNAANSDFVRMNADLTVAQDTGAGFGANPASGASIEDLLRDSQGRLLAAGDLSYPNPNAYTTNVMRILANNTVDTSFKLYMTNSSPKKVISIKESPGGKYVIGGTFTNVQGQARNGLARINTDGSLDTAYDPFSGVNAFTTVHSVQDVAVLPDGAVLVVGNFVVASESIATLVARINSAGVLDTAFVRTTNFSGGTGYAVLALPNGKIMVGGDIAGNPMLYRLNADGTADSTFVRRTFTGSGPTVRDLEYQPDGRILVSGKFTGYNGVTRESVFRLLQDGTLDTEVAFPRPTVVNSGRTARTVRASADGQYIYVGYDGGASGGGTTVNYIRFLNRFQDPCIATHPASVSVNKNGTGTLTADVYSSQPATYQWFKNGVAVNNANATTLTLSNVQEADTGAYTLQATTQGQTLTTEPAQFRVLAAPVIANSPASVTVLGGKPYTIPVDAFGQEPAVMRWYQDGVLLTGSSFFTGFNSLTLSNATARLRDNGLYKFVISNALGMATSAVQVVVTPQPAHLAPTYVGPGPGSQSEFNTTFNRDDGVIVYGTNLYLFGVTYVGNIERHGIARTDFDLNTKDLTFNPPFTSSTAQEPYGGIAQSDGKLVISAFNTFSTQGAYTRLLRLNSNGSLDTTFKTNGMPDQQIEFITPLPNDKFAIYGRAITKAGKHVTAQFVVYNADGSPDTGFKVPVGLSGLAQLTKMQGLPDGKLLVAAQGNMFGGATVGYLFRLQTTGALDTSFTSSTLSSELLDFDVMADGRIVVGGNFQTVGGFTRAKLARLLPDGTRDTTFTLTNIVDNASGFFPPLAVVVDDEGGIIVGASTITVDGVSKGYGFRVGPDSKYDPNFLFEQFPNYRVNNFKKLPDGRILMGTESTSYNLKTIGNLGVLLGYPTKLGILRSPVSQRQPLNGSATLDVQIASPAVVTYQWYKDGLPLAGQTAATLQLNSLTAADSASYSVRVQNVYRTVYSAPGRLDVMAAPVVFKQPVSVSARLGQSVTFEVEAFGLGSLTYQWQKNGANIDGATGTQLTLNNITSAEAATYRVLVFNTLAPDGVASQGANLSVGAALAGTVDTAFAPPSGLQRAGTVEGIVETVLWDFDNKPLVGGFFETINGTAKANLVRFNTDGTTDTTFAPAGGPNNYVWDIVKSTSGQFYVAGSYSTWAGVTSHRLARINTDGSRDTTFAPASALANNYYRVVEGTDGKVYAGFNSASPNIAKFNGTDGVRDTTTFTFGTAGTFSSVEAIAIYGNSQILVGGGGQNQHYVYRYSTNGTYDNTWTPATSFPISSSQYVYDTVPLTGGGAIIGGQFQNIDSVFGVTNLAVLGSNGRIATNISTNLNVNGFVKDIYVYPNGKILIAGAFTSVKGVARPGLARLNADYSLDTTLDPGTGPTDKNGTFAGLTCVDVRNDGKIVVGGYFSFFDGAPRGSVAVLNGDPVVQPLAIVGAPQPVSAVAGENASFSVAVSGGTVLSFQWYKGTDLIPGATLPYLTLTNVNAASQASYKVTVTSGIDSITSTPVALTVQAPTEQTYTEWLSTYTTVATAVGPDDDIDGDGLLNAVEYILGTSPVAANPQPLPMSVNDANVIYPGIQFTRSKSALGLDIVIEASLNATMEPLVPVTILPVTDLGNGLERYTVRVNTSVGVSPKAFFRLKAVQAVGN